MILTRSSALVIDLDESPQSLPDTCITGLPEVEMNSHTLCTDSLVQPLQIFDRQTRYLHREKRVIFLSNGYARGECPGQDLPPFFNAISLWKGY